MLKKLHKNKKGQGIPIVSDVVNAIGSTLQSFIQSAPPAATTIFFLMFLIFAIFLLGLGFRLFGYHCNADGQPMSISPFNLPMNVKLIFSVPDVNLLSSSTRPVESRLIILGIPFPGSGCAIKNSGQTINGVANNNWVYLGESCTTCTLATYSSGGTGSEQVCNSDAYRLSADNKSIVQKFLCGGARCEPPENYYWQQSTNLYICQNQAICSAWTIAKEWDKQLSDAGATLLYPNGENNNIDDQSAFSITCDDKLRASPALYQIPIFDFRIWLFGEILLVLIGFMVWVVSVRKK